ncbi:Pimeloyl-ACP methyl ester carboxylesterase [Marininema mesophilum]|uniref:Pimeloyl-ACP methyl ester carboxylesterase n=1 Tax=Marininema mesophilum TaxID=1048340 RepID=A0A1H2W6H0_9BACL|nr:alpha/beta fold hydrolase [Marininema mesophilum]SDW76242.1 Pimeloyl-ACP methyl ester carboxylesterase [Marininema mesophilum]
MPGQGSVLWLSGWSVDSSVWDDVIEGLSHEMVHRKVDFNGCTNVEEMFQRVETVLALLPSPVRIVGWSLGALVALELAHRWKGHIHQLFLIGSTGRFVRGEDLPGWDQRVLGRMERRLDKDMVGTLNDFDSLLFSKAESDRGEEKRWRVFRQRTPSEGSMIGGLQMLAAFDWYQWDVSLAIDTHLLSGQEDRVCQPEGAIQLYKTLPSATLSLWEGVGHLPFWTQQEQFREWLEERMKT